MKRTENVIIIMTVISNLHEDLNFFIPTSNLKHTGENPKQNFQSGM